MDCSPPSPKRRRISKSPNIHETGGTYSEADFPNAYVPMSPSAFEAEAQTAPEPRPGRGHDTDARPETHEPAPKPSKFRFKSKHSSSSRRRHRSSRHDREDDDQDRRRRKRSKSPSCHHQSRRRHRNRTPDPDKDKPRVAEDQQPPPLSPNTAFRESLFDAMADDEGAAYWEGVYGQPIHVYSRDKPAKGDGDEGGRSEVDRMTDDEYAAYVRQKMWEKTHAGLVEEKRKREEARKKKEEGREKAARLTEEMERSLRRGEERRRRKAWKGVWEGYVERWAKWDGSVEGIPWPTRGGKRDEVDEEKRELIREFFEMGLERDEIGDKEFAAKLKEERVRWHPDKVQQKLGGTVDAGIMKDVTAIFQVVDKLWNDTRSKT